MSQTSNFGVPSAYDTPEASRGRHGLHGLLAKPQTTPLTEVRLPMTSYSFFNIFNQVHYRHYRISTAGRWRHHSCSFEKAACASACLVILSNLQQGSNRPINLAPGPSVFVHGLAGSPHLEVILIQMSSCCITDPNLLPEECRIMHSQRNACGRICQIKCTRSNSTAAVLSWRLKSMLWLNWPN